MHNISYFDREIILRYQEWMITKKNLSPKTYNLRLIAIRSFLEYAAQEELWITPLYDNSQNITGTKTVNHPIEYFEPNEFIGLLVVPDSKKKSNRRNQMILILMYDTAQECPRLET